MAVARLNILEERFGRVGVDRASRTAAREGESRKNESYEFHSSFSYCWSVGIPARIQANTSNEGQALLTFGQSRCP